MAETICFHQFTSQLHILFCEIFVIFVICYSLIFVASSQEVSNASQGSTPQVSQLFCMYILLHVCCH